MSFLSLNTKWTVLLLLKRSQIINKYIEGNLAAYTRREFEVWKVKKNRRVLHNFLEKY